MGFAGAQRLDERRRRRLAGDAEPPRRVTKRRVDAAHVEEPPASREAGSPILTWMPRARWPLAVLTLLSGAALAAAVVLSVWAETRFQWAGTLGVRSGRLLATLGVGYCFATAVLCYLVFWFRKRSRQDFAGKYRRWLTAAAGFAGLGLLVGTGVHANLGGLLSDRLPPAAWNTPTACWLVPVATAAALVGPTLLCEMMAAGAGALLMLLGGVLAAVVAAVRLVGSLALDPVVCDTVCELACVVSLWALFHAAWWHARHVVRVCNEPPKSGQLRAKLRRAMPSRPRRVAAAEETESEEADEPKPRRRGRRPAAEVEVNEEPAEEPAERAPGLLARVGGLVASPVTVPVRKAGELKASMAASLADRRERRAEARRERLEAKEAAKAARAEAKELARLEAEEKRRAADEAKAAAAAEKEAAKEAAAREAAAAKEAKRQAKQEAADSKAAARAAAKAKPPEPAPAEEPPQPPQPPRELRVKKTRPAPEQNYEEPDDWSEEDGDYGGGGRKQRRKKKRRGNAA